MSEVLRCPDCGGQMFRAAGKIGGKWQAFWICDCVADAAQIERWELLGAELLKKHSGMTAREKVEKHA